MVDVLVKRALGVDEHDANGGGSCIAANAAGVNAVRLQCARWQWYDQICV